VEKVARTKKKDLNSSEIVTDAPDQQLLLLEPERYEQARLVFEDGALILKAVRHDQTDWQLPDYFVWHAGHWAAPAYRYAELRQWLEQQEQRILNYVPHYMFQTQSDNAAIPTVKFDFKRRDGLGDAVVNSATTPSEPSNLYQYPTSQTSPQIKVAESVTSYLYQADVWTSPPKSTIQALRPYQQEAIESWKVLNGRGTIVLPTGSGKSIVATLAIDYVQAPTLIVVPQLDLLHQWYENLSAIYGQANVGVYFGEKKDIRPITVTTYVSASSHLDELGNRFYLLICDEVHHLTSAVWQQAARLSIAPKRLALTATYPTDFDDHLLLQELIGPPCYYKAPADLAGTYLAEYETIRVRVEFTPEELAEYAKWRDVYKPFVQKMWKAWGMRWYDETMRKQNRDIECRQALVYKGRMEKLIEMARAKRLALARILALHPGQSAIIFTETNQAVYELAEMFMLPAITYQTGAVERKAILDGFRNGEFPAIVTARVLNEGVDLPTAKVAVILGGAGSSTEYVQRLGRILRRQGGAKAFLYEVIVRDSLEENVSSRRRLSSKNNRAPGTK
jgi:superfamily II DNA or RNA helicase